MQLVASFILSESWIDAKLYGESRGFLDWFRIDLSTLNTLLEKGESIQCAMLSFATPLASQIGFSIASLNKNNYKSIELELSQVIFTLA